MMRATYHDCEAFRANGVRKDLQGICDQHWRVGDVIKEIKDENEWDRRCSPHEVSKFACDNIVLIGPAFSGSGSMDRVEKSGGECPYRES